MLLTVEGTTQPITEWALDYGIPVDLIRSRLDYGWDEERAVTEPQKSYGKVRLSDAEIEEIKAKARAAAGLPPIPRPARTAQVRDTLRAHRPKASPVPKLLTFNGKSHTVNEWAEELGLKAGTLRMRFKNGWSIERALSSPGGRQDKRASNGREARVLTHDGKSMTVIQWANHLGIQAQVIHYRLRQGWPLPRALDPRIRSCRRSNGQH